VGLIKYLKEKKGEALCGKWNSLKQPLYSYLKCLFRTPTIALFNVYIGFVWFGTGKVV